MSYTYLIASSALVLEHNRAWNHSYIIMNIIINITCMVVHKFIHYYVSVEQTIIILIHFTESPRWSNPENNHIMTDVRTSDSLGVVRVPYGLNRSPWVENLPYPLDADNKRHEHLRLAYSVTWRSLTAWIVLTMRTPCIPLAWIARDMPPTIYINHGLVVHKGLTYSCLHVYLGTLIDPINGKVLLDHACKFLIIVERLTNQTTT
jgi:hypothetical protein